MSSGNEPKPAPDETDAEAVAARAADKRAAARPTEADKPDEGLRPDQLTTENDGGSQG